MRGFKYSQPPQYWRKKITSSTPVNVCIIIFVDPTSGIKLDIYEMDFKPCLQANTMEQTNHNPTSLDTYQNSTSQLSLQNLP